MFNNLLSIAYLGGSPLLAPLVLLMACGWQAIASASVSIALKQIGHVNNPASLTLKGGGHIFTRLSSSSSSTQGREVEYEEMREEESASHPP